MAEQIIIEITEEVALYGTGVVLEKGDRIAVIERVGKTMPVMKAAVDALNMLSYELMMKRHDKIGSNQVDRMINQLSSIEKGEYHGGR